MFVIRTVFLSKPITKILDLLISSKLKQQQQTIINYPDAEVIYPIPPYDDPLY
jgi:hypothetical protein